MMDVIEVDFTFVSSINSSTNDTQKCEMDFMKIQYPQILALFSMELTLALAAFMVNFGFLIIIRSVQIMPSNVRYLLAHLSFTMIWLAAANMYKIFSFLAVSDPCSLSMGALACRIRELTFTLPANASMYSILGICIERLFSTFYRRNKDHPAMALGFILIIWSATFGQGIYVLSNVRSDEKVPVCEPALSLNAATAMPTIAFNLIMEIASVMAMLAVTYYENYVANNMAINRVRYSLSARFLIAQNVEVNSLMLPSMLLHAFSYMPSLVFSSLVIFGSPMATSTKWLVIHFVYLWRLIYCVFHPLLAFARNYHVKKQLKKNKLWLSLTSMWKRWHGKVANTYGGTQQIADKNIQAHFDYLEHVWSTSYRMQKPVLK